MVWIANVIEKAVMEAIAEGREPLTKEELARMLMEVRMEEGDSKGVTGTIVLRKVKYDEFVQVAHAEDKIVMMVSQGGRHEYVWLTPIQAFDLAQALEEAAHVASKSAQKDSENV